MIDASEMMLLMQVGIWQSYVLVTVMVTLLVSTDIFIMWYLTTRPWYSGGNGSAKDVSSSDLN